VTITHTSAVFALGLITLAASAYVLPEDLYPWLGVISGAMVIAIGLWAIWTRLRRWRALRPSMTTVISALTSRTTTTSVHTTTLTPHPRLPGRRSRRAR
jgi:ABC-type nickel/cobalt efflux system permease component RcnA